MLWQYLSSIPLLSFAIAIAALAQLSGTPRHDSDGDAPAAHPAPIDAQVFAKLCAIIGPESHHVLKAIIDSYLADTPERLAEMCAALDQDNTGLLRAAAHKLKSSSALLAAMTLGQMCNKLEDNIRNNVTGGLAEQVRQIEAEFARARAALEAERDRLG